MPEISAGPAKGLSHSKLHGHPANPRARQSLLDRWILSAIRVLRGKQQTSRIGATADWLYPAYGKDHPAYKRTRYLLRCLMFNRATRGWLNFLFANPELLELLQRQPSLAEKVHRPYLRKDLSAPRRLAALKTHYTISLQHTLRSLLLSAAHVEVEIASFCGKDGAIFRLALCPPGSLQKEGEIVLRLDMAGRVLYRLAFSLIAEDARQVIFIGSMQGPASGHDGGELVRAATKSLHGLRPRDLVIDVLQVLAESLGVTRIAGVGQAQHIYRHLRKQREFMQDYDRLWTELGGSRQADGTFDLPMTPVQRPLTEYPSKKRAEASRRQILERQVWEDVRRHATPEGAESDG